ncbi:AI-2E family transporter [Desulfolithobacter sp.]
MKRELINKTVLLTLVLAISGLFLNMISQFLMPIFLAGLFSALASPLYHWLEDRLGGRSRLASMLTILGIVCLILLPLGALLGVVVTQAIHVGQSVTPWVQSFLQEPSALSQYLERLPYYEEFLPYRDLIIQKGGELVGHVSTFLVNSLSSATRLTVNAVIMTIIMLYVMFYFLSDGHLLLEKILYALPLEDHDEKRLLVRFTSVTRATIKSTMIIGLIQGLICGVGFHLAGIPSPVFWGTVMAVLSIIPAVGTSLVWAPAVVVLGLAGDWTGVAILIITCGVISGNIDNLLRPRLVGKDTEMHDLMVLFGTLGGIAMFGLLGIIIGPIIAALFVTIWEIYTDSFKDYLPEVKSILGERKNRSGENKR